MGPTNVALVKLYRADQALRDAQQRLDAATKNVRLQDRRCNDLAEKLKVSQARHRELLARGNNLDLDIKSRDAQIERLRTQQQSTTNAREYQSLLVEINTRKVDRAKVDEEAMKTLEQSEATGTEATALAAALDAERAKLAELKASMGDNVTQLQAEIASLQAPRDELAAALPPKARTQFDKLADHHEGEALAALIKPDRRKEEYACSGCMMDLVTDVYNKLHSRDDLVFCPSCRRILYIPDELPPELAVNTKKGTATRSSASTAKTRPSKTSQAAVAAEPVAPAQPVRPKTALEQLLTAAHGESVKNAVDADQRPLLFTVTIDGRDMGQLKGKSADNLERIIKFRLEEANLRHEVTVTPYAETSTESTDAPTEPVASA
jgi:predicted  nucleic acid-binding Zn-ribbon protein